MDKFLQHTIIGAEFDSSDRHPPPRCHPGTRLAIIERCLIFISQCDGKEKMRWVVGPAGIGKSAVMQIVAEETPADASVFFSVNGRQDGGKVFTTIAYQLAVKYEPYRRFIRNEISRDPSVLRKSLPAQFQKFIVDPFLHQHLFNLSQRFVIIIDGLDECNNRFTQREFLGLISDFCIKYPTSPLVWFIASRPEPHITSFFDDGRVGPAYIKEEMKIDSDEACEDVQRYLRDELKEVKLASPALRHKGDWPSELEFTKIATAAGGLFAYASTVVRYIGDPHYRDPVAQLGRVLETIDAGPKSNMSGRDHPMAQLDALYQRILSSIPPDLMTNAKKLLLVSLHDGLGYMSFRLPCNMLGLSEAAAYSAVAYLHAILKVPAPDKVDDENLEFFHKSFPDFLNDFERSRFSQDVKDEFEQLKAQSLFRIVAQVPDDLDTIDSGNGIRCGPYGCLKGNPSVLGDISLSWPGDVRYKTTDNKLRDLMYNSAMFGLCHEFTSRNKYYMNMSCFHYLTTRFLRPSDDFPIYELLNTTFDRFRPEFVALGKLKQMPLRTLDYAAICGTIDIHLT
ncbi:hypothetical protein AGABI2DRAFT_217789, partial [Agaricus bisporus var. bisporus H97]|uniref:hypothetical protein n=1 Tax=Agaricus bisporus var. bisporus (strain H97 / ATCC MYA-4626 / FGSC 10389) TaxID=936046 RepID=UPI00029F74B0